MKTLTLFFLLLLVFAAQAPAFKGECAGGPGGVRCMAEQGDAEAQFELGMLLLLGDEVAEDKMQALKWLSRSAKQGHPEAETMLDRLALATEPGQGCSR